LDKASGAASCHLNRVSDLPNVTVPTREPDKYIYGKYVFVFPVNIVFTYIVMYKCVFAVFVRAVAQFISLATGNQPLHGWLWAINLREGNDLLILQLPLSNDHLLLDTAMEILLVAFP